MHETLNGLIAKLLSCRVKKTADVRLQLEVGTLPFTWLN